MRNEANMLIGYRFRGYDRNNTCFVDCSKGDFIDAKWLPDKYKNKPDYEWAGSESMIKTLKLWAKNQGLKNEPPCYWYKYVVELKYYDESLDEDIYFTYLLQWDFYGGCIACYMLDNNGIKYFQDLAKDLK